MSRIARWIAIALVLALLIPAAGQALPLGKVRPAGPEPMSFLDVVWAWITDRVNVLWEAEGWGMDPDGSDSDDGCGMDPNGCNNADEGWGMDPNG
ncbi:MAG TPA: hypothetical protein VF756_32235 [Thermoanaerobaculia bacterium]